MQPFESLNAGGEYHVYSHGVGGCDLFVEPEDYDYFLKLYGKYVSPVADTHAWVWLKNHFHVLVRVDENGQSDGFLDLSGLKNKPPHQHFSNLFNAYSKAINKLYNTHGALFERPFQRKRIDNPDYLCNVVAKIHHNPVHYGFCKHPLEYPWSSYLTCLSDKPTQLRRDEVMSWFGNKAAFEAGHESHDLKQNWHLFEFEE
ncbi:hypothetical protein LX69_03030 [Breznakibacter xylanolyticus]|uniref:Transposase IS200-like domain-containing protein n=1 Tax=Breznakibacter xylanolyticus TaxID=990 RepID=A0A2W7N031_9BACT|nr:hypothetical protein [Breznakibacter xylanolyticus]PZX11797.1 hypothetical protein LX69_03030 [Breznakibacter xylanolyticus]